MNQAISGNVYISYIKEVNCSDELMLVCNRASKWESVGARKIGGFKKDFTKRQVATDAVEVAAGIYSLCKSGNYSIEKIEADEKAIFIAVDNRNKIQGIALLNLCGRHNEMILDELIVNPQRNAFIGSKYTISGIGTKLVQAIANKILQKENQPNLKVFSLNSAIPFYLKLGFVDVDDSSRVNFEPFSEEIWMSLSRDKLTSLSQRL